MTSKTSDNELPGGAELEEKKFLLEKAKFFRDHVQGILNLATGSLVLSITFLHDLGTGAIDRSDLGMSWRLLGLSILFGLSYNYVLAVYTRRQRPLFGLMLGALSLAMHGLFFAGLFFIAEFGLNNLH